MPQHDVVPTLAKRIRELKAECSPEPGPFLGTEVAHRTIFDTDFGTLTLRDEDVGRFDEIKQQVLRYKGIGKQRSEKGVTKRLQELIVRCFLAKAAGESDRLEERLDALLDDLIAPVPERTVYFPVAGLQLEDVDIQLGDVRFLPASETFVRDLQAQFADLMLSAPSPYAEGNAKKVKEDIASTFQRVSVGSMVLQADGDQSIDAGLPVVSDRLDLLAAMMPGIVPLSYPVWFEVGPPPGVDGYCMFSIHPKGGNYHGTTRRPVLSVVIGQRRRSRLVELGLEDMSDLAGGRGKSDADVRTGRMAKWLGRSLRMTGTAEKFLMACNALEAAFSAKGNPVSKTLSEGCAFVCAKTPEDRRAIVKEVSRLYDLRSGLVHGRDEREITLRDVHELQNHVHWLMCLVLMNRGKFRDVGLGDWAKDQMFGKPYDLKWPQPWNNLG